MKIIKKTSLLVIAALALNICAAQTDVTLLHNKLHGLEYTRDTLLQAGAGGLLAGATLLAAENIEPLAYLLTANAVTSTPLFVLSVAALFFSSVSTFLIYDLKGEIQVLTIPKEILQQEARAQIQARAQVIERLSTRYRKSKLYSPVSF